MEPVAHTAVRGALDHIGDLVGIALEVVELVELAVTAPVYPVDVLVAVGPHGLVGHGDQPRIRVLRPVFDEEGLAPGAGAFLSPGPREERQERASLDVLPRFSSR